MIGHSLGRMGLAFSSAVVYSNMLRTGNIPPGERHAHDPHLFYF